jgi:hypothetical protein
VSRTLAMTALPQSASAGAALAEAALAEAALAEAALAEAALASIAVSDVGLASVVALASIVDSDPAPSPSIAVSDLALASIAVSDVGLASVVALPSIVALASIVDSDPAPSPSIAVSDLALASTVDSVAGLASVDLVVDGSSTPPRPPARLPAALRLPAGSKACVGMKWGEKGPAPYGTRASPRSAPGCHKYTRQISDPLRREGTRNTMRCASAHSSDKPPSPPFGRLGSPAGLDRPFEMVWRELPKWDCAGEAHFKRGERRRSVRPSIVRIALPVRRPSFCRHRSYRPHGHPTYVRA